MGEAALSCFFEHYVFSNKENKNNNKHTLKTLKNTCTYSCVCIAGVPLLKLIMFWSAVANTLTLRNDGKP